MGALRVLMVPASPLRDATGKPLPPLDTVDEVWRLGAAIERTQDGPNGASASWIRILHPQSEERLRRWLGRGYPIVHFSCHGEQDSLILENDLGVGERITGATLADWLRLGNAELVVISACDSEQIGQLLYEKGAAACIIATRAPIRDEEARDFCGALYGELVQGRSVAAALDYARLKLKKPDILVTFPDDPAKLHSLSWTPGKSAGSQEHATPSNNLYGGAMFPYQLAKNFVGRHAELRAIDRWLDGPRHVMVLAGLRCTGKTNLAVHAALRLCQDFKARVFVSVKDVADFGAAHVLLQLQKELQEPPGSVNPPQEEIARLLNDRSVFLILDNVDLVKEESAQALVSALQALGPRCLSKVLLTSHALALRHPLIEAIVDKKDILQLNGMDPAEAVRLLFEAGTRATRFSLQLPTGFNLPAKDDWDDLRRRAQLPSFWTTPMVGVLDELAGLAFHHPPLLEHAGEMVAKVWSADDEDDQDTYKDTHNRLSRAAPEGELADELERCRNEIIAEKIMLLNYEIPNAVKALYAALPFTNGATEAHLRYVALGRNSAREEVPALFRSRALKPARESGLLRLRDERYELPAPVRDYLQTHPHPHKRNHCLRHAEAVRELASANHGWRDISPAIDWLAREVRAQAANADVSDADRLLLEYAEACLNGPLRGRLGSAHLDAFLLAAEHAGSQRVTALAVEAIGSLYLALARKQYEEAERLYNDLGARRATANVQRLLGDLARAHSSSDPEAAKQALDSYRRALSLFTEEKEFASMAQILESMAQLHFLLSEDEQARACLQEARACRGQNVVKSADPSTRAP